MYESMVPAVHYFSNYWISAKGSLYLRLRAQILFSSAGISIPDCLKLSFIQSHHFVLLLTTNFAELFDVSIDCLYYMGQNRVILVVHFTVSNAFKG